jgi:hypothetical protein
MKQIKLTQTKKDIYALVDDGDFEWLKKWTWHLMPNGYVARHTTLKTRKTITLYLHRIILHAKKEQEIDHRNRNKLDNRRSNLRVVTTRINMLNINLKPNNSSGYKGVTYCPKNTFRPWVARIRINGIKTHLGAFKTIEAAANIYKEKLLSLGGIY